MVVKVLHYYLNEPLTLKQPVALAMGYFDGLHLGHQALANKVKDFASEHQIASALMTFSPNPLITLGKMEVEHHLTSFEDRAKLLEKMGIDYLIIVNFDKAVSHLSPEDFFKHFIQPLDIRCLVCGFDYHFGSGGKGNGKLLKDLAADHFEVYIQEEIMIDQQKVSSTRIQKALCDGQVQTARHLLGRPYCIKGEVIKGRQIGRTIGFPTANVDYGEYAVPKNGVYGVKIEVDQQLYMGMCNIGYNPTFDSLEHRSLEVNIFDFDQDIYGKIVHVYFYCLIRDEVKFSSPQELISQLNKDKKEIIGYFLAND